VAESASRNLGGKMAKKAAKGKKKAGKKR